MLRTALKKLRGTREVEAAPPPRVGVPRITFNQLSKANQLRLHAIHTGGITPGSVIAIFAAKDERPDAPAILVTAKRDFAARLDGSLLLVKREDG